MTKLFKRFLAMTMALAIATPGMPISTTVSSAKTAGEVTSCNQLDSNKWQVASTFELEVYGEDAGNQTASGRDDSYSYLNISEGYLHASYRKYFGTSCMNDVILSVSLKRK